MGWFLLIYTASVGAVGLVALAVRVMVRQ